MMELGSSPELREVVDGLASLTRAVGSLIEVQAGNTKLLEYLAGAVAQEPDEGQELHKALAKLVLTLQRLPAEVEAAVARGIVVRGIQAG